MKRHQHVWGACVLAVAIGGCSRAETGDEAREAAAQVRTATVRAGEELADGWLTTKIQSQYFADRDVKAGDIDVSTRDAIVTLSGYVANEAAREQAVQIARNTDGVRQVTDRLRIGDAPAPGERKAAPTASEAVATAGRAIERSAGAAADRLNDARVTTMIQAKYFLDTSVKERSIDVETRNGVVTLRGAVASEAERAQALLLARNTDGVQRVEDTLT